jgi:hypothetical protein
MLEAELKIRSVLLKIVAPETCRGVTPEVKGGRWMLIRTAPTGCVVGVVGSCVSRDS